MRYLILLMGGFRAAPKSRAATGSEARFMFKKEVNICAKRGVAPSLTRSGRRHAPDV